MKQDGFSTQKIRLYLARWTTWWVSTSEIWQYGELLWYLANSCWNILDAAAAAALFTKHNKSSQKNLMELRRHQDTFAQH